MLCKPFLLEITPDIHNTVNLSTIGIKVKCQFYSMLWVTSWRNWTHNSFFLLEIAHFSRGSHKRWSCWSHSNGRANWEVFSAARCICWFCCTMCVDSLNVLSVTKMHEIIFLNFWKLSKAHCLNKTKNCDHMDLLCVELKLLQIL